METKVEQLRYEAVFERDDVSVSKSPWGPDDEIGRMNWITPDSRQAILEHLDGSAVFDLAVEYFLGMPSWAAAKDPKYEIWMTHTPQGSVNDNLSGAGPEVHEKYSYCGDSIAMYTHCGTHIDTLNHLGFYGLFWNGWTADEHLGSRAATVAPSSPHRSSATRSVPSSAWRCGGCAETDTCARA